MATSRFRTALALSVMLAIFLGVPVDTSARGSGRSGAYTPWPSFAASNHRSAVRSSHTSITCASCLRDSHGKIKRDPNAVSEFTRTHPKPPGCNKCEVDHIVPPSKGRRDDPSNMQWLPKAQHQDKTKRDLRP